MFTQRYGSGAVREAGEFAKHIFREHNEVTNDWAQRGAKGERIRWMTTTADPVSTCHALVAGMQGCDAICERIVWYMCRWCFRQGASVFYDIVKVDLCRNKFGEWTSVRGIGPLASPGDFHGLTAHLEDLSRVKLWAERTILS